MRPTEVMAEFSEPFVHKRLLAGAIGLITGGPAAAVAGIITDPFGRPVPSTSATFAGSPQDPCPGGFRIPGTNRCFETPFVPRAPDTVGTIISGPTTVEPGAFGELSVSPVVVSAARLRCPPGLVLGKDNRCYAQGKGGITNAQRKWPKAPRPIMSAQDGKVLRRAESIRGRAKRAATSAGFTCKKR